MVVILHDASMQIGAKITVELHKLFCQNISDGIVCRLSFGTLITCWHYTGSQLPFVKS